MNFKLVLTVLPLALAGQSACNVDGSQCPSPPQCAQASAKCEASSAALLACASSNQTSCEVSRLCHWLPLGSYPGQLNATCVAGATCESNDETACGSSADCTWNAEGACKEYPSSCDEVSNDLAGFSSICQDLGCSLKSECGPADPNVCGALASQGACGANNCTWFPLGSYPGQIAAFCYDTSCGGFQAEAQCDSNAQCNWQTHCEEQATSCGDVENDATACSNIEGCFPQDECSPNLDLWSICFTKSSQSACEGTTVGTNNCQYYPPGEFPNPSPIAGFCFSPATVLADCASTTDLDRCRQNPYCAVKSACQSNKCFTFASVDTCITEDGCFWNDAQGHWQETTTIGGQQVTFSQQVVSKCEACRGDDLDPDANFYLFLKDIPSPVICTLSGNGTAPLFGTVTGSVDVSTAPQAAPGPICLEGVSSAGGMVLDCTAGTSPPTPSPTYSSLPSLTEAPTDTSALSGAASSVATLAAVVAAVVTILSIN